MPFQLHFHSAPKGGANADGTYAIQLSPLKTQQIPTASDAKAFGNRKLYKGSSSKIGDTGFLGHRVPDDDRTNATWIPPSDEFL
jgi:hypothetical protein